MSEVPVLINIDHDVLFREGDPCRFKFTKDSALTGALECNKFYTGKIVSINNFGFKVIPDEHCKDGERRTILLDALERVLGQNTLEVTLCETDLRDRINSVIDEQRTMLIEKQDRLKHEINNCEVARDMFHTRYNITK